MRFMVSFVLRACASDEIVQSLHLRCHVFHLCVDDANGLFVDGLGGCLDCGVVLVDSLERQTKNISARVGVKWV